MFVCGQILLGTLHVVMVHSSTHVRSPPSVDSFEVGALSPPPSHLLPPPKKHVLTGNRGGVQPVEDNSKHQYKYRCSALPLSPNPSYTALGTAVGFEPGRSARGVMMIAGGDSHSAIASPRRTGVCACKRESDCVRESQRSPAFTANPYTQLTAARPHATALRWWCCWRKS